MTGTTTGTGYDFDDGNGPVAAHRHPNGGGWVADTARVSDSAQVSDNARVSGNALVFGNAQVFGNAWVLGTAWVSGDALVFDNAQVSDNAQVFGNAWVSGDARVFGDARVSGDAQFLLIGPIGSRNAYVTWTRSDNCITTGCFRGTVAEFRAAVDATHGTNAHGAAYRAMLDFIAATRTAWEAL